ncbi:MAG: hypothetical protein FWD25_07965 [Clostridia bacterium]|nr:hypothetical protein [Clostridia bacterium]
MDAETVLSALSALRIPPGTSELEMHARIAAELEAAGIACTHEAKLGPRCRIDFLAGGIGIEVKCGKPSRRVLLRQLGRYASCEEVQALIVVVERSANLPAHVGGKPCYCLSMNRLWGIALPL